MTEMNVEEIDLEHLVQLLRQRFGDRIDASYLRGKTLLRDAVRGALGCSDFRAEELVETLELRGYIRFPVLADETHPAARHVWHLGGQALDKRGSV